MRIAPRGRAAVHGRRQHAEFPAGQSHITNFVVLSPTLVEQRQRPSRGPSSAVVGQRLHGGLVASLRRCTVADTPDLELGSGRNALRRPRAAHPTAGAMSRGSRVSAVAGEVLSAAVGHTMTATAAPRPDGPVAEPRRVASCRQLPRCPCLRRTYHPLWQPPPGCWAAFYAHTSVLHILAAAHAAGGRGAAGPSGCRPCGRQARGWCVRCFRPMLQGQLGCFRLWLTPGQLVDGFPRIVAVAAVSFHCCGGRAGLPAPPPCLYQTSPPSPAATPTACNPGLQWWIGR